MLSKQQVAKGPCRRSTVVIEPVTSILAKALNISSMNHTLGGKPVGSTTRTRQVVIQSRGTERVCGTA